MLVVDQLLSRGVDPKTVAYTSFTKAAAHEAAERAQTKFSCSENALQNFRTLHSICYRSLGRVSVMSTGDWVNFALQAKLYITLKSLAEDVRSAATKGDHILSIISLARNHLVPIEEAYKHYPDKHRCTLQEVNYAFTALTHYKESKGKLDFTDLLEQFLVNGVPPTLDYIIGDEMQDLTPLQWKVFYKLAEKAKEVWMAGDDDQSIFEWAGATPNLFIDAPGEVMVLGQSYRIPKKVHDLAVSITDKIKHRLNKAYLPREAIGDVTRKDLWNVDMSKGNWLLLVRNAAFLPVMQSYCYRKGWATMGEGLICEKQKQIVIWEQLRSGKMTSGKDVKFCINGLKRGVIKHGFKQMYDLNIHDDQIITIDQLVKDFGLQFVSEWKNVFNLSSADMEFLSTLEKRGELTSLPRIEFSTIHNAKGRECDNVVICVDQTARTQKGEMDNPDAENRVWYVGVTRAKETLTLLNPLTSNFHTI